MSNNLTTIKTHIDTFLKPISTLLLLGYWGNVFFQMNSDSLKSKISSKQKSLFTLKDVAGNKEEKEEMKELIDFLNNPHKYQKMGA
ncbi:ATP-dependent zinc metalloprotease FtsH, partial ['Camptotheca acuminata' phytoplasma]